MTSIYSGYTGKILDIDLTTKTTRQYRVSDQDREMFLGGRYLSTKILWDKLPARVNPLSPQNILVIMTSPLTGTGAPSSSRFDISAKSPLTHALAHSNSGGNFGIHLKRAGWDGIIIRGRATEKVFVEIEDQAVRIHSAEKIWGLTTDTVQQQLGKGGKIVIGPAGENQVKFATIVSQERVHGRCGMGAVMGSKNLKAIVVKGHQKLKIHDPQAFKKTLTAWTRMLKAHPATGSFAPKMGTAGFLSILSRKNALPTKNFVYGQYANSHRISGERLAREFLVKTTGCVSCPIRCGRVVNVGGQDVKGPEYEILCMFGANLLIDDMEAIIGWNHELDRLGLDTISTGNVIAFAAELNEKGLWENGIHFGQKEIISDLIQAIAYRKDIGNVLGEGVRSLAAIYGGEEFAAHVKGLEIAAYSPRAATGHALGYATATRGACHLDGGYMVYLEVSGPLTLDPLHFRSKPGWVILDQNLLAAISSGGNCLFTSWTFIPKLAFQLSGNRFIAPLVTFALTYSWFLLTAFLKLNPRPLRFHLPLLPHSKAIAQATGMRHYFGDFAAVGARGYTLERLFNLREGIGKSKDNLPRRFTDVPLVKGKSATKVPLQKMLPQYYRLRGWDENGIPTKKTLKKLGLGFIDHSKIYSTAE